MRNLLVIVLMVLMASGCGRHSRPMFDPMVNYGASDTDTVLIDMDLSHAAIEGIMIPSLSQGSAFRFVFDTHATSPLYYKIYYQNDSYKFPDQDTLAYENFYGSWADVSVGFKPVPTSGHIEDSFRIVGNPRDEKLYYGQDLSHTQCSASDVEKVMSLIATDSAWYASVLSKAAANGNTVSQQLRLDAQWVLSDRRHEPGGVNHRWKRNPRVGCYSFLLVVCDSAALSSIPDHIVHIGEPAPSGQFENPFSWFSRQHKGITLVRGSKVLRTRAVLTPRQGMFVDLLSLQTPDADLSVAEAAGLMSDSAYRTALFQQFFPAVSHQYTLRNIPRVAPLDDYSLSDYQNNVANLDSSTLCYDYPKVSSCPATTVVPTSDCISLINPPSTFDNMRKESTGVRTRVGFSYGRYRGRIKFPPMLNRHHVWNGLTYAFWLIYQDDHPWNVRRTSYRGGYIDKGDDSDQPQRMSSNHYSEIDIEIVKASPYWPESYGGRKPKAHETAPQVSSEVMFSCTNWDLACPDPDRFASGVSTLRHEGTCYELMRWYPNYKALTLKTPISNDIFSAPYYFYEIEWTPQSITWRLGPDPDHMRVVGFMDDRHTSIPNNQMVCVVTQEFHYSEWWPPVVFEQGCIPFNSQPVEGKVYEIIIE